MERFRGLCYPITRSSVGLLRNTDDLSQLKADMAAIILTVPGERVMQPDFGTDLVRFNFNQPQELVMQEVRQRVAKSLKKWEKRVQVNDVLANLFVNEDNEMIIQIRVLFIDPVNLKKVEQLNIEKFIGVYDGRNMPF